METAEYMGIGNVTTVCEPRPRDNWDRLGLSMLTALMWGACGYVVYLCASWGSAKWQWWFAAGSAVAAVVTTCAWFAKPRGRITLDEASCRLVVEDMPIYAKLTLWPHRCTTEISFGEFSHALLVPARYGSPSLRILTTQGVLYVPGEWIGFSELCEGVARLQKEPLRRTTIWIGFYVLVIVVALAICGLVLLLFNWP